MTDAINTSIEQTATAPASVTAGGVTVNAQSLQDQIAAAKYLAAQQAVQNPAAVMLGMAVQVKPPGAV